MKTFVYFLTDSDQITYHRNGNMLQVEYISPTIPYSNSYAISGEVISGEVIGTVEQSPIDLSVDYSEYAGKKLYRLSSDIYNEEEIKNKYSRFGTVIDIYQASVVDHIIDPERWIYDDDEGYRYYTHHLKAEGDELIYNREKFRNNINDIANKRANIYSLLQNISIINPTYSPPNILADPIVNLDFLDTVNSSNYVFVSNNGSTFVEADDETQDMVIETAEFPITVNSMYVAGYGVGDPYRVYVSNDGGTNWVETTMNDTSITDEVDFALLGYTNPTAFKARMVASKGALQNKPFLTSWGFIFK